MMQQLLRTAGMILIAYSALYSAIWLHELGHALVFQAYGCNEYLLVVVVPWHFANANPGPLDPDCLNALSTESLFLGGMGGIMMNILLAISTYFFWKQTAAGPLRQWLLFFGISHLLEVATYLTISNILPMSDMISVQEYEPLLRIPLFLAGVLMIWLIIRWIRQAPVPLKPALGWFSLCTALSMGGLRLVFTYFA